MALSIGRVSREKSYAYQLVKSPLVFWSLSAVFDAKKKSLCEVWQENENVGGIRSLVSERAFKYETDGSSFAKLLIFEKGISSEN